MHRFILCLPRLIVSIPIVFLAAVTSGQMVINVPPDLAPTSVAGNTILNLLDGGTLAGDFQANDGSVVNILGGIVECRLDANAGSTIHINGGRVVSTLSIHSGAALRVTGGNVNGFVAWPNSTRPFIWHVTADAGQARSRAAISHRADGLWLGRGGAVRSQEACPSARRMQSVPVSFAGHGVPRLPLRLKAGWGEYLKGLASLKRPRIIQQPTFASTVTARDGSFAPAET